MTYLGFFVFQGNLFVGHPGYGGQTVKLDRKNNLAFAYITNGLQPGMGDLTKTMMRLQMATYESLGIHPSKFKGGIL